MPFLDAIPVNVFILGTSILAGVILFLILWQIPDEPEEGDEKVQDAKLEESEVKKSRPSRKK